MKKNLLQFLFGESQVDGEIAEIVESISDLDVDDSDDLKVEKQPLAKALSSLGIEAKSLENDPRGLSLVFSDADDYRSVHAILNEPDSLHKLASLGWVFSTQGDVAMANEPAELRIRFLEINEVEPANAKASYSDSDKARLNKVKEIIKKGREFATEEPDFNSEDNPVDHESPKNGIRDKGVEDAKDGSHPEGSPKTGLSKGPSRSSISAGGLTHPKEGAHPTGKLKEGKAGKVHCKFCGSAAHVTDNCPTGFAGRKKGDENTGYKTFGEAEILHAPGCSCPDCSEEQDRTGMFAHTGKPNTMGQAAAGQHSGRPWGIGEAGHKSGCKCGFCKNRGNIHLRNKSKKDEDGTSGQDRESYSDDQDRDGYVDPKLEKDESLQSAAEIVNSMLEGNPGTPPGIMGTKSFSTMKVPGSSKDRKFSPAKGMVQAAPENTVVAKQTKPNRSA